MLFRSVFESVESISASFKTSDFLASEIFSETSFVRCDLPFVFSELV